MARTLLQHRFRLPWHPVGVLIAMLCAAQVQADPSPLRPLAGPPDSEPVAPWQVMLLPKQTKPSTRFTSMVMDGRPVLRIVADHSYATLVHPLPQGTHVGHVLSWRWRIDEPLAKADLHRRSGDDTAVKVCALFDEPLENVPVGERLWLKTASTLAGTDAPTATVCYVWDAHLPAGTVVPNAFTRRVRYLVLRSADTPLASWSLERRDLHADFLQLFGDEAKTVPRLMGVMVGGDADNTQGRSTAYLGDLVLEE
jgi:hypothetical protein